jgi:CheY-like chemotaxis protein
MLQAGATRNKGTTVRVLVVDDDPSIRRLLQEVLAIEGFDVLLAADGDQAIRLARTHQPNLILMDLMLPVLDGLEATRRLKADPLTERIPIIVVSAVVHIHRDSPALPADGYLAKPIRRDSLQHVIADACRYLEPETPEESPRRPPEKPVVDPHLVLKRVEGDMDLLQEIIALFLAEAPTITSALDQALAQQDCRALERAAHRLRGAVGHLGAGRTSDAALRLEEAARKGDLRAAASLVAELKLALGEAVQALRRLKEESVG